ncbi:esterase E4-like [Planococcus citri]|uniref:esterase E4-like n=1 Tax=Planococcus citri TaxID=170843 RepID=UPI0031FA1797
MKDELYVTIPQGKLLGKEWISTFTGDTYYGFSRIPYAKPPVKELRFMPPQPADGWQGVRDATIEGDDCLQYSVFKLSLIGSEDCLHASIYTPEPPCKITSPKPVIVIIHWGGHAWGSCSSKICGCVDFMMKSDVVIVAFNYRLHVFGFLNLGIPECPGNMGLKDQVMLLKWVQNNIKYFGGDPNNVTLHGISSGASSVHLHMMSPMSKGLFHKVILQSGYALNPIWSYQVSPYERALELANVLGYKGSKNPQQVLKFFKSKNGADIVNGSGVLRNIKKTEDVIRFEAFSFLPSIERIEEGAFMLKTPREMFADMRPVPALLSMNQKEGMVVICADNNILKIVFKKLGKSVKENLWHYKITPDTLTMMTKKIRSFYFEQKNAPTADEIANLYTDMWFCEWNNMIDSLAAHPDSPPVYIYHFTFDGEYNFSKKWFGHTVLEDIKGAIHADDASYLLTYRILLEDSDGNIEYKEKESEIIRKMVSLVTNFVKTGNPNSAATNEVYWKPFHPQNPSHLLFDENLSIVEDRINPERVALWNEFIDIIKEEEPTVNKPEKNRTKMSNLDEMSGSNFMSMFSSFKP